MVDRSNMRFTYTYVEMGSIAGSNNKQLAVKNNRIFLDVGNALSVGVIDHHHRIQGVTVAGELYRSATKLVTLYPEYILDNVNEDTKEVELVLHLSPDFDCFAAAYLTEHLIKFGAFPIGYEAFADYVDMVDAGVIRLKKDNFKEVYAIAYSIGDILRKELEQTKNEASPKEPSQPYDILLKNRWYHLFDHILQWVNAHKDHTLYGADIFNGNHDFEKEIAYVQEDYEVYKSERKEPGLCEKVWIRLPNAVDGFKKLYEVEGLLYHRIPRSCLTKLWARIDNETSSGSGFLFTFIPAEVNSSNQKTQSHTFNRVIISLEPNSGYSLKGLARQLECAEKSKEELLFATDRTQLRCRDKRRPGFHQDWICNDDPWYDGRNFNYTIVDSPRCGSLLSFAEIKDIVMNYTIAKVNRSCGYFILPFTINKDFSDPIFKNPGQLFQYPLKSKKSVESDYFLSYISRYLNNQTLEDSNLGCKKYHLVTDGMVFQKEEDGSVMLQLEASLDHKQPLAKIKDIELIIYKYGVGFLSFDLLLPEAEHKLRFDQLLEINNTISHSYKHVFDYFSTKDSKYGLNYSRPLLYTCVEIDSDGFYNEELKEMIYKLCNCQQYSEPYANSTFIENSLEQLFMEMDDTCCFGFSKRGGALICTPKNSCNDTIERHIQKQIHNFRTDYYEIFLFAMHQRLSLLRMENLLSEFDGKKHKKHLGRLRKLMMNFVTQGWFSQITENEIGQEIYRRWQSVFECETLYQEVMQQIESVDEYRHAQQSKLYEYLSILVFPLLFVVQILSSGLIKTTTVGPDTGIDWRYTLLGIIIIYIICGYFFFKNKK